MISDKKVKLLARASVALGSSAFPGGLDAEAKECVSEFMEESIKLGAELALADLWHNASEKPKQYKMIVAITGEKDSLTNFDAEVYNFPFSISKGDWVDLVDQDGIVKWCYIDDLLPKKGGEG